MSGGWRCGGGRATISPSAIGEVMDLAAADVVLMRQDPPFDMAYITATHLLEHIHPKTLVVNDPFQVRNAPEKLFVSHFPELMPPTPDLQSRRRDQGVPGTAPRHHRQAAVRQTAARGVLPPEGGRRESRRAPGDVHPALAGAGDCPEIPAGDPPGRQAHHPDRGENPSAPSPACRRGGRPGPTSTPAAGRRRPA